MTCGGAPACRSAVTASGTVLPHLPPGMGAGGDVSGGQVSSHQRPVVRTYRQRVPEGVQRLREPGLMRATRRSARRTRYRQSSTAAAAWTLRVSDHDPEPCERTVARARSWEEAPASGADDQAGVRLLVGPRSRTDEQEGSLPIRSLRRSTMRRTFRSKDNGQGVRPWRVTPFAEPSGAMNLHNLRATAPSTGEEAGTVADRQKEKGRDHRRRVRRDGGGLGPDVARAAENPTCEVTIFQMGGRLGGKGASSRNPRCGRPRLRSMVFTSGWGTTRTRSGWCRTCFDGAEGSRRLSDPELRTHLERNRSTTGTGCRRSSAPASSALRTIHPETGSPWIARFPEYVPAIRKRRHRHLPVGRWHDAARGSTSLTTRNAPTLAKSRSSSEVRTAGTEKTSASKNRTSRSS